RACSGVIASSAGRATAAPSPRRTARREIRLVILHLLRPPVPAVLERVAPGDLQQQRGDPVLPFRQRRPDRLQRRGVEILYTPPQGVGRHFLRQAADKVVFPREQQGLELDRPPDGAAVGQGRGGLDRVGAVSLPPGAYGVVVLEREPDRVHAAVTVGAAGVGALLLEGLSEGQRAVRVGLVLELAGIGERRRRRRAEDRLQHPLPPLHR